MFSEGKDTVDGGRYTDNSSTIKREIEDLKSRVNIKPPTDIWVVWAISDDPEEDVEAFRVVSDVFPNSVTIRCKRKDLQKKIDETKLKEG